VIADGSKQVARLGGVPVPVEILPFACASVLAALGGEPVLRLADGKPYRTDNGNWIADVRYDLADPAAIARHLDSISGVLGHGLFLDEVDAAYLACRSVVTRLERIAPSA
jgi:ribose 5-phosphate isomerase A